MYGPVKITALTLISVAALGLISGCAGQQMVNADVPLRRVVLYRNGVGYFERAGQLDGDTLQFRVRREHVGDFLATLAVIDSNGHARSVSFPSLEPSEGEDDDLVDVRLELGGEGDEHDLVVAYVVETPIWRPSYRIVLDENEALLQGWAVVQNLSGEDWTDVNMAVTSGAPLSFRADLGRPVIPSRPMVTDSGEVVAGPVYSEIALGSGDEEGEVTEYNFDENSVDGEMMTSANQQAPMTEAERSNFDDDRTREYLQRSARPRPMSAPAAPMRPGYYPQGDMSVETQPRAQELDIRGLLSSVQSLAVGAVHEGVTRYDVSDPVTVPDNGSTMVAIINQPIPGEDALLYRPDPSVPESSTYPMRVVRIENNTGVLIERGPVAIYQTGSLLGQGLLEPLPDGATTSIPFAIERGVAVELSQRSDQSTGRLLKIANGRLTIEQFSQRRTVYQIRNGLDRTTKLYLRHSRMVNWEIVDPPEGSEDVEQAMLLPVDLAAHDDAEFEVLERTPVRRVVDLMSDIGAEVVLLYLEGPAVDAAAGPVLRQALGFRERLLDISRRRSQLAQERRELQGAQSEVRANLNTIRDIPRARDLRDRLMRRMTELASRIDRLTNSIVELDAEASELRVRLSESLRELTLEVED